jgi:hypothetical protein
MNIIREQRENIIKTNNTAQSNLIGILEKLDNRTREISINDSLHGNLDFYVLEREGFNNVKTIILTKEGEVTSITNLPTGLEKLHCGHQFITELTNLPSSLVDLNCESNYVENLDFSKVDKLKFLKVTSNHLTQLENLPDTLEELYCNNNRIKILHLNELLMLRVLHTSNNKAIIIEGLPPSVVDFQSENNPYIEIEYANMHRSGEKTSENSERRLDYIESLHDYFKLKSKYEEQNFKLKKKAFEKGKSKKSKLRMVSSVVLKCINCKQPGGTLFSNKDNNYYAICGNKSSPCNLKIEIYNGRHHNCDGLLMIEHGELNDIKTNIIREKLNTIFSYVDNSSAAKKFKEQIEQFTFFNADYTGLLEKNNNLYKNEIREELIRKKSKQIYELTAAIRELINQYEKDNNHELLKTAIQIQIKELNPEIHNLRLLRNEINEMDLISGKKSTNFNKESTETNEGDENELEYAESYLIQKYAKLSLLEENLGRQPAVVKYSKK